MMQQPWMPWKWCMGGGKKQDLTVTAITRNVAQTVKHGLLAKISYTAPTAVPVWTTRGHAMKIENNKIVEITEDELFALYLRRGVDDIMDFNEYKMRMKNAGCVVICEE